MRNLKKDTEYGVGGSEAGLVSSSLLDKNIPKEDKANQQEKENGIHANSGR